MTYKIVILYKKCRSLEKIFLFIMEGIDYSIYFDDH